MVCRFANNAVAIDGVSFSVERGEMVCVMGASGCGKSTLLRALSGQFRPSQGSVLFNKRSFYESHESLRKYVAYIPQYDAFDEHLTIEENLEYAAAIRAAAGNASAGSTANSPSSASTTAAPPSSERPKRKSSAGANAND